MAMALAAPLIAPLFAQEGHPLKGSWIGVWQTNAVHGDDVLIIMNWDGKAVSGIINPGTDDIAIKTATLDPNGWKVHIEADAKDKAGAAVHYVIDGAIQKLEMTDRAIVGTWSSQRGKGKFEIHRQ
jgi:citrate lyase gamma subunit